MNYRELGTNLGLLAARLAGGAIFIVHGYGKVNGGMEGFTKALTDLSVPMPGAMAWVAALWELVGGALLVAGLFSRMAALGLAGVMLVAIVKVHLHNGFLMNHFNEPGKQHGYEFAMACGALALVVALCGAGKTSLDSLFFKEKKKH